MKKEKSPLKIGDAVTTSYHFNDDIVRLITRIEKDKSFGSGWLASADGGEPCPTCGRLHASPIFGIDSAWFKKVSDG